MKKLLFIALMIPLNAHSQKVSDEIDKFTKKRTVSTEYILLKRELTGYIRCQLRMVDTLIGISFHGGNLAVGVIGENDQAILLLNDSSTVTIYSTGMQSYNIADYGNKWYDHTYVIDKSSLEKLANRKIISIRFYVDEGHTEMDINSKNALEFQKLSQAFLNKL